MDITWHSYRSVLVRTKRLALAMEPDEIGADTQIVTLSTRRPKLGACLKLGGTRVLSGPGEFDVSGVALVGTAMGTSTVFTAHVEDVTLCYLAAVEIDRLAKIGPIDVLVVPVGAGGVTVGQAAEAVAQLEPKVIVPLPLEEGAAEALCKQLGAAVPAPKAKLALTADGLPEARQVLLLEAPRVKRAKAA